HGASGEHRGLAVVGGGSRRRAARTQGQADAGRRRADRRAARLRTSHGSAVREQPPPAPPEDATGGAGAWPVSANLGNSTDQVRDSAATLSRRSDPVLQPVAARRSR